MEYTGVKDSIWYFEMEEGLLLEKDPLECRLKGKGEITSYWRDDTFHIVSTLSMTVEDVIKRAKEEGFEPEAGDVEAHIIRWAEYGGRSDTYYDSFDMFSPSGHNRLMFLFTRKSK